MTPDKLREELLDPDQPLGHAKAKLTDAIHKGKAVDCPCCGQLCKIYSRTIHASMAAGLVVLERIQRRDPLLHRSVDVRQIRGELEAKLTGQSVNPTSDFAKLRYWDLIKEASLNKEELEEGQKRTSGRWSITRMGSLFVRQELKVPRLVKVYNGQVLGFDGETITIRQALAGRFNWEQLWAA